MIDRTLLWAPQVHVVKPSPPCDGTGVESGRYTGLGEVVKVWSDDSRLLVRRDSRELACRLHGVGALREGGRLQAGGALHPGTASVGTEILDFRPPEL